MGGWTNDRFVMDENLYWDTSHPAGDMRFGEATLAQWQARGHDRHSLVADPKFVDAAHGDFRLKADSPALKLGFVPIDTSKIGLYGEPDWVAVPKRIVRQAYVPTAPADPPPEPVDDDFEGAAVGAPPDSGFVNAENVGGIVVTNETAATGKQCLKFIDAPGQKYSFNPAPGLLRRTLRPGECGAVSTCGSSRAPSGTSSGASMSGAIIASGRRCGSRETENYLSQGRQLDQIPLGRWLHVEIACGLGDKADGRWTLAYGPTGGATKRLALTCDPKFKRLDWVGFSADATIAAVFYVDNVKIGPSPAR